MAPSLKDVLESVSKMQFEPNEKKRSDTLTLQRLAIDFDVHQRFDCHLQRGAYFHFGTLKLLVWQYLCT